MGKNLKIPKRSYCSIPTVNINYFNNMSYTTLALTPSYVNTLSSRFPNRLKYADILPKEIRLLLQKVNMFSGNENDKTIYQFKYYQ